jgi:hypothetical protein
LLFLIKRERERVHTGRYYSVVLGCNTPSPKQCEVKEGIILLIFKKLGHLNTERAQMSCRVKVALSVNIVELIQEFTLSV